MGRRSTVLRPLSITEPKPVTSIRPALYCAFDVFPSAKGAAVHIDRFARRLFDRAGGGILYVLGDGRLAPRQVEGPVEILRFTQSEPNLLARALAFGRALERLLAARGAGLRLAHFRDPWGGMAVLDGVPPGCRTLYEVNGLPSIELPFAYPGLPASTIDKLRAAELSCLDRADRVVTPSRTIAENLKALGADPAKIRVIPNGADPSPPASPPAPPNRLRPPPPGPTCSISAPCNPGRD
jgi:glycosyltransferase involved in cell wall biosynthesis